jgi:YesN/AraC family two-component response regulator
MDGETKYLRTPDFEIDYRSYAANRMEPLEQYHNSCEIALFIKADIKVFLLDRHYKVGDLNLLFIGENEIHKILYAENMYYKRYVINVKKSYIDAILSALKVDDILDEAKAVSVRSIALKRKQFEHIKELFREIHEQKSKAESTKSDGAYQYAHIQMKLVELLMAVNEAFRSVQQEYTPHRSQSPVQDILKFIDRHCCENITLDMLEKAFFLNKYHIAHIFKEETGFTVIEYIQLRRVMMSQDMLKQTDRRIVDVCVECGFNNLQHFYRVFKKITHCTPLDYRKKNRLKKERDCVSVGIR